MNKRILKLAIPNIISNITVPLLGFVDMIVVGHMGNKQYIGAVLVGTAIFNFVYWNFGFLRMGTTGFTAQAYGRGDFSTAIQTLARALTIGVGISLLLIILQQPLVRLALHFIKSSEGVSTLALGYYQILIWAAPAILGLYALKGWFIGMQNSWIPMFIAIAINLLNIGFCLLFVLGFNMKVEGVALGTLIAQYAGLAMAVAMFYIFYRKQLPKPSWKEVFNLNSLGDFFKVNSNIFIRTLCLVSVFTFFTSTSAEMGDTQLAVNGLLLQLFTLFSYIMDGFAYAGESLVGRYVGERKLDLLKKTIRLLLTWGLALSLLFTMLYAIWGKSLLGIFTPDEAVLDVADSYLLWVLAVPLVGFSAFLWDGVFVGAAASAAMRNAMLVASAVFFILYYSLAESWHAHALWFAFLVFLALRGILQRLQVGKAVYSKIQESIAR